MDVNTKNLLEWFLALISSASKYLKERWQIWLFCVVCLVAALLLFLSGCSSKHYLSINADEMSNPSILYNDSTDVQYPKF